MLLLMDATEKQRFMEVIDIEKSFISRNDARQEVAKYDGYGTEI